MSVKPKYNYLDLTRKDRRGTLVLLLLILLVCIVPFAYPLLVKKKLAGNMPLDSSLALLKTKQADKIYDHDEAGEDGPRRSYRPSTGYASYNNTNKGSLFDFDPNTISEEGWKKLGLRDKTIATIMNYRSKGGKFKQAEDIKNIWGLFPDEAARLLPYVHIAAADNNTPVKNYSNDFYQTKYDNKKEYASVDINASDTSAWIALPGIGSKLSQRIINFRDKLGGFNSIDQVAETFGLADSTFQKIKPFLKVSGDVRKININTATIDELKLHPYVRYQLGNAIVQFRTQHGNFTSIQELKKIMIITEEIFNKLSPYLAVD